MVDFNPNLGFGTNLSNIGGGTRLPNFNTPPTDTGFGTGNSSQFAGIKLGVGLSTGDVFQSSTSAVSIAQTLANGGSVDPSSLPGISPEVARSIQQLNNTTGNAINGGEAGSAISKLPKSMQGWAADLISKSQARKAEKEAEGGGDKQTEKTTKTDKS